MKILVLGGYGGFGARIARRLSDAGHDVLVGGRSLAKAEAFCAGRPRLTPIALDRDRDLTQVLAAYHPDILVDAAGPFQGLDYAVPRACITAGTHYLDIADARDFVTGIGALDQAARAAGVAVISGASSVPALSGAVVRMLADGMEDVRAVEMAISASNRATAGPSVAAAILGYVGKPFGIWRGQRKTVGHGWQEMRRERFEVSGIPPLDGRLVALADIPDLDLLPERLPGRPAVSFRAGTELSIQNIVLWLASWLVRWRWVQTLAGAAGWLLPLQRLTASFGSDRSAMIVRLFGILGARRVEHRWTLIVDDGHGPEIPALAVPLLVERISTDRLKRGARDAGEEFALSDFASAFDALSIRHERRDITQPPPLYERIMGGRFDRLPHGLRMIHDVLRDGGASGRATVKRGRHPLARLIAWFLGFPPEGDHDLHVHFEERDGAEIWTRRFSRWSFQSRLSERDGQLVERFGPLSFAFDLPSDDAGLTMAMCKWWLGPIRLPLAFAPRSEAREWEEDGRFWFDVPIALLGLGLIVHYRGWLQFPLALTEIRACHPADPSKAVTE